MFRIGEFSRLAQVSVKTLRYYDRIDRFIQERGGVRRGKHHEIYLSDLRGTAPERLKTIIRHPFG